MKVAETIQRVWVIGAAQVPDPCSAMPFSQAFMMLCKTHPQARHTQVFEQDGEVQPDGSIHYKIHLIPAKTNG